jgi:hypothetical protein
MERRAVLARSVCPENETDTPVSGRARVSYRCSQFPDRMSARLELRRCRAGAIDPARATSVSHLSGAGRSSRRESFAERKPHPVCPRTKLKLAGICRAATERRLIRRDRQPAASSPLAHPDLPMYTRSGGKITGLGTAGAGGVPRPHDRNQLRWLHSAGEGSRTSISRSARSGSRPGSVTVIWIA